MESVPEKAFGGRPSVKPPYIGFVVAKQQRRLARTVEAEIAQLRFSILILALSAENLGFCALAIQDQVLRKQTCGNSVGFAASGPRVLIVVRIRM